MYLRKICPIIRKSIWLLLFLILTPAFLSASQFISKKTATIGKLEKIDDDLYIFANYSKLFGSINGDLTAFCYEINSVGEINGNANLFGYRVDLYGKTNRSARLFGYMINTNGDIGGNLMVFGNDASIGEKSIIKRDFLCRAQRVNIDGTVQGNANIAAANVVISGTIEGNADITAEKLMIVPPAIIKGYLHYTSRNEAVIEEGSVITGDKRWKLPEVKKEDEEGVSFLSAIFRFALFVMALVTGLVLILFFREHTRESSRQIEKSFWVTLATGCLAFIVFTFGAIILLVLIIGIPLALLLISLGMTLFYVGKIYLSIALGRWIFRLFRPHREFAIGFELLLGLIVLTILFQLPYLGCLIYIITALIGMGAAIRGYHAINHKYKTAIAAPTPAGIA